MKIETEDELEGLQQKKLTMGSTERAATLGDPKLFGLP